MQKDTMVRKSGWDLIGQLNSNAPRAATTQDALARIKAEEFSLANSFRDAFTKGTGPEVLEAIERYVYGKPLLEEGPNMTENNLARSGMREVVELIHSQILRSQRGEKA
jgi:hypothetical protein